MYSYDDEIAYFDYEHLNAEGEPRIIAGFLDEFFEVISEDLGDYLLESITDFLEYVRLEEQGVEISFTGENSPFKE